MSASIGMPQLTYAVGGIRFLTGAVSEHRREGLNLCGIQGLAALASSPKARVEMARLKVHSLKSVDASDNRFMFVCVCFPLRVCVSRVGLSVHQCAFMLVCRACLLRSRGLDGSLHSRSVGNQTQHQR